MSFATCTKIDAVFPRIVFAFEQFPPLNSFPQQKISLLGKKCHFLNSLQFPDPKKNIFRGHYLWKYGRQKIPLENEWSTKLNLTPDPGGGWCEP